MRNKFDNFQETSKRHTPNDKYENSVTPHIAAAAEGIPNKSRTKRRVRLESMAVREKRENFKISLLERNPINANALKLKKLKKARRELTHTKKNKRITFEAKSIKSKTRWRIDNHE